MKRSAPSNRELRTRKDLLQAAARLIRQGRKPTMEEVAREALVSRPTAYRYFRSVDVLLAEAPVDSAVKTGAELFAEVATTDPAERVDLAEASMHTTMYANEAHLRVMLASSIGRDRQDDTLPKRQNRRIPLIESALAPARSRFREADYQRLCAALALMFGPESMIVFRDVIHLDEKKARQVKSWAVRALVRAALDSSAKKPGRSRPS